MAEVRVRYVGSDEQHFEFTNKYNLDHKRLGKLSQNVLSALERYTSNRKNNLGVFHHLAINKAIEKSITEDIQLSLFSKGSDRDARLISKSMTKSFHSFADFVYKGIRREREFLILKDKKVGDEFSFNQFVSTSYSDVSAMTHATQGVILEISNPRGIPVRNNDEIEFLLPAQSKLKIITIQDEIWITESEQEQLLVIKVKNIENV